MTNTTRQELIYALRLIAGRFAKLKYPQYKALVGDQVVARERQMLKAEVERIKLSLMRA